MFGILGAWSFLIAHPLLGLLVFGIVTCLVLTALSGGHLGEAIGSIFRVLFTFFTTPFVFLRDAMTLVRRTEESEQDYRESTTFMLFRANRIQYVLLLLLCLLVLSSGITSGVLSLYPQAEIEQSRILSEQVTQLETDLQNANAAATNTQAPGFREELRTRAEQARAAYRQQAQSNAEFLQTKRFNSNLLNTLLNTNDISAITQIQGNLDVYLASCPRGYEWQGMSPADCVSYRQFLDQVATRRIAEINRGQAASAAEAALQDADNAAENANAQVADIQQRLDYARQQRQQVSIFNPDMIKMRLAIAGGTLLSTLFSIILLVWLGATVIDLFNWAILMMRSAEKTEQAKLESMRARP